MEPFNYEKINIVLCKFITFKATGKPTLLVVTI